MARKCKVVCPRCGEGSPQSQIRFWGGKEHVLEAARHEAGHALLAWILAPDLVDGICIHPDSSGQTHFLLAGRIDLHGSLTILLAGPAAGTEYAKGTLDMPWL